MESIANVHSAGKYYLAGNSSWGMNNQFILNNEPGKQCRLGNLGSILVFESLVWLCHSDAEGHCPSPGAQATVSRQPSV